MSNKWDSRKRIKFFIALSVSLCLFLAALLLVIWSILLTDRTRSTHVRSEYTQQEIFDKNYIKGFEHITEDGKFTYSLREDEINDLLYDGVQVINDRHIENIYYERGSDNTHTFYVDLKKTFFKTRVVITTTAEGGEEGMGFLSLNIKSAKMGKIDVTRYLERKGYLTDDFVMKYSTACGLPALYSDGKEIPNETHPKAFAIPTNVVMNNFPKTDTTSLIWDEIKENNFYSMNTKTLGFSADFSKLRTKQNISAKTFSISLPNFYDDLKEHLEAIDIAGMSTGEKTKAYEISLNDFDQFLTSCIPINLKEEVSTTAISTKATFNLVGTNTTITSEGKLDVAFLYSLNGYLVDIHQIIKMVDVSYNYFDISFEIKKPITFNNVTRTISNDKYLTHFNSMFEKVYKNIPENQSNFISYLNYSLRISLNEMNNSHSNSYLRNSWKSVEINPSTNTIDFIVEKTV